MPKKTVNKIGALALSQALCIFYWFFELNDKPIKVNGTYYEYRTKDQSPCSGCRTVPTIQMKGHWLQKAGFEINTPIKIRVMDGCLVITTE